MDHIYELITNIMKSSPSLPEHISNQALIATHTTLIKKNHPKISESSNAYTG